MTDRQPLALPLTLDRGNIRDANDEFIAILHDCSVRTASAIVAAVNASAALRAQNAELLHLARSLVAFFDSGQVRDKDGSDQRHCQTANLFRAAIARSAQTEGGK